MQPKINGEYSAFEIEQLEAAFKEMYFDKTTGEWDSQAPDWCEEEAIKHIRKTVEDGTIEETFSLHVPGHESFECFVCGNTADLEITNGHHYLPVYELNCPHCETKIEFWDRYEVTKIDWNHKTMKQKMSIVVEEYIESHANPSKEGIAHWIQINRTEYNRFPKQIEQIQSMLQEALVLKEQ